MLALNRFLSSPSGNPRQPEYRRSTSDESIHSETYGDSERLSYKIYYSFCKYWGSTSGAEPDSEDLGIPYGAISQGGIMIRW